MDNFDSTVGEEVLNRGKMSRMVRGLGSDRRGCTPVRWCGKVAGHRQLLIDRAGVTGALAVGRTGETVGSTSTAGRRRETSTLIVLWALGPAFGLPVTAMAVTSFPEVAADAAFGSPDTQAALAVAFVTALLAAVVSWPARQASRAVRHAVTGR
ncbi:hypothetical protein [Micromonospora sp. NPDC001898]|uniref:hypothetical protein n=1 Tax=Micromonospora sp. NPDC001898 TaxID=3364221 RepID=UPI00369F6F04